MNMYMYDDKIRPVGFLVQQVKQVCHGRPDSQAIAVSEAGKEARWNATEAETVVDSTKGKVAYDEVYT